MAELEESVHALFDSLPDMVPALVDQLTPRIIKWVDGNGRKSLRKQRKALRKFESRVARTWQEPFELLDLVIHLAMQVGHDVGGPVLEAEEDGKHLASVIIRLHGRGLRIAREVLALLRAGFPDAALARWRTLHEVTVVAAFVLEHGEGCAERYVAHQAVANYKGALRYQDSAARMGYVEFTPQDMAELKRLRDEAVGKYGSDFGGDYGWAADYAKPAPANFAEIEKAAALDHYRSVYKWASQEVHAGVKALFSDLAAPSEDLILIGPSNTGFADPGQNTCITLAVLSAELVLLGPTLGGLVSCSALNEMVDRAAKRFVEVQQEVESVT